MGIGPRAARVHVGSGRPTVSTGAGPVTLWTGAGGRKRRPSRGRRNTGTSRASVAAYERQARQAQRIEEIAKLAALESAVVSVHREAFPEADRGEVDPPLPVDEAAIRRRCKKEALRGISVFDWTARRAAKEKGRGAAQAEIQQEVERRATEHAAAEAELDAAWERLLANDPQTALLALEEAFEDNHAPAVPVDCAQGEATIVMIYPAPSIVPDQKAAVTPSGKPTIHRRSKTEQYELYAQSLASNILATVREGFAVAPGLRRIVILSVAKDTAVGGIPTISAIAVTGFDKALVDEFNWDRLDPWRTIEAATPALINRGGRAGELAPLDLTSEPDIASVVKQVAQVLDLRIA